MRIIFRADASLEIGTGHVMRMLALAQACSGEWRFVDCGGDEGLSGITVPTFVSARLPETLEQRLTDEGCEVIRIDAAPGSMEDIHQTVDFLHSQDSGVSLMVSVSEASYPDPNRPPPLSEGSADCRPWLVLDGYHFGINYQRAARAAGYRVMVMDDYGHCEMWCADIILNQNIGSENRTYCNEVTEGRVLLGPGYALLRKEFWNVESRVRDLSVPLQRILVTLGGVDPENVTGRILDAFARVDFRPLHLRVLLGVENPHRGILEAQGAASRHRVELIQYVTDMPSLYYWADGVVSAGGSTCYEWLLYSLPAAVVTLTENQVPIVDELVNRGIAVRLHRDRVIQGEISAAVLSAWLLGKYAGREQKGPSVVDGLGALRSIARLGNEPCFLRKPNYSDARMTWEWANEKAVREMSFSSEAFPYDNHVRWWKNALADEKTWIRIVESIDEGSIGIVRLENDCESEPAIISINLSSRARGRGYGTRAIQVATEAYCRETGVNRVFAYAKTENTASWRAFQKAGYSAPVPTCVKGEHAVVMTYCARDL